MKTNYNFIFIFSVLLLLAPITYAGLNITAVSPQSDGGIISVADADSFHIDIMINLTGGIDELCGGSFAFELYSPDNSITSITHLAVPNGQTSTASVEYLNGFSSNIFNIATLTYENGWGVGDGKAVSTLPDSISFILAGTNCMTSLLPDQAYIRFNLQSAESGTFCIDSISNSADDIWDWLFQEKWDPVSFGGPYCYEITSAGTDIAETDNLSLPRDFGLAQNFPNPFNPSTTIEMALPRASDWNISIYNVIGQLVKEFSGFSEAGYVTVNWEASRQSSGMYFYKATAGDFSDTRKMILLK